MRGCLGLWFAIVLVGCGGGGGDDDGGDGPPDGLCDGREPGSMPLVWGKVAGGTGVGVAADADGGTFVTGQFSGVETFGVGEEHEVALEATFNSTDAFLSRREADGAFAWAVQAGGTGTDTAQAVAAAPDGGVVVAGQFGGTATFGTGDDEVTLTAGGDMAIFVARYEPDGALGWVTRVGGTAGDGQAQAHRVAVAADGSVRLLGSFIGPATFGEGEAGEQSLTSLTNNAGADIFLASFEPDGAFIWVARSIGPYLGVGPGLAVTEDGATLLSANLYDGFIYRPGEADETMFDGGIGDVLVMRYEENGDLGWAKRTNGDVAIENLGRSIAEAPDGSMVVTGSYAGTVVFGPGEPGETTVTAIDSVDFFVARYDADGELDWVRVGGGPYEDAGIAIGAAGDGSVRVALQLSQASLLSAGAPDEVETERGGAFLLHYGAGGDLVALAEIDRTREVFFNGMSVLPDGSMRVEGRFTSQTTLGAGEPNETTLMADPAGNLVARYDTCP